MIFNKKNKKGSIFDLFIWIIIGFITVIFLALWLFSHALITSELTSISQPPGSIANISQAAEITFGSVNTAMGGLRVIALIIIVVSALSILLSNFLVKSHPAFFIVYIFITILAIMLSIPISNAYERLMLDPVFGDTLSSFTGSSWIMLHLPTWVTVIGIFGSVLLFAGITRDSGTGGSVI